jgi:hypothetical protein
MALSVQLASQAGEERARRVVQLATDPPPLLVLDLHQASRELVEHEFGGTSLGQVAGHLGKPAELAVVVAQRRDDDVGPEACPILPYSPALFLHAPVSLGLLEKLRRMSFRGVLASVERGHVLADDFVGLVPLDAFGSFIPACDLAGRVEHEDRIVLHATHQESEVGLGECNRAGLHL